MKKLLRLFLICSVLTTFSNSVALPLNTVAIERSSENEDVLNAEPSEDLENAYMLLKQFVEEQKESGNKAFSSVMVYTAFEFFNGNDNLPEEYQYKVILEYFWSDEETILDSVKAFMQENGINENLVVYFALEDAPDTGGTPVSNLGDVDEDGSIDILDVIKLNRAVLGKELLTDSQNAAADVNKDDKVDATDSLVIMKYIVGLIENFEVQ